MERYSEYKDSGVQWLGEIPSHWKIKRLAGYFSERRVKVSDKDYAPLSVTKNGIFPQLENVAKTNDGDNRKLVLSGDFVINSRSDRKGSSGIAKIDGSVSLINIVLEPRKSICPVFCNYLLKSYSFIEEYYRNGRGIVADLWTTRYDEMKMIKISVPSPKEQESIAAYLDDVTGKIDKVIAQQQKMIGLLNERKQIIINHAVTKGLNPDVSMKDSGMEWIGQIPEHWEICKLKYLFRRIADGTHFSPSTVEEGYPYITASDVRGIGIDYANAKKISLDDYKKLVAAGCRASNGDILLVKDGATTGRVGLKIDDVECVTLSSVAMLTPKETQNTYYLMYMMMSDAMQKQIFLSMAGAAMPRITLIKLNNFLAVKPPIDEQFKIVKYVKSKIDPLNRSIRLAEQQIVLLQERKQIIINEVVTGKVKVS